MLCSPPPYTNAGREDVVYTDPTFEGTVGVADFIAQEEMDRYSGFWWSPCSTMIAFQLTTESHIPEYRIMHQGKRDVFEECHRYPFAGAENPRVRLAVQSMTTRRTLNVDLSLGGVVGDADDLYLARVAWLPDGRLTAQVQSRDQTQLWLVAWSGLNDQLHSVAPDDSAALRPLSPEILIHETTDVWINLHHLFKHFEHAGKRYLLWGSERTGFRHIYLYHLRDDGGADVRACTEDAPNRLRCS